MSTQPTVRNQSTSVSNNAVREGFKAHTKGEKRFNDLTYVGLGYFGVTGFSVFMTWLFRDTEYFGPKFAKAAEHVAKWLSKGGEPTAKNLETTQSWLRVGALFTGGSIMTVTGVKALEDNKAAIVKHFDKEIYGEDAVNNDPEIVAAHKMIEAQPRQTWASVGWSRVVAFVATMVSWFVIGSNSSLLSKHIGVSFDKLGLQFGRLGSRLINQIRGSNQTEPFEVLKPLLGTNRATTGTLKLVSDNKDSQLVKTLSDLGADGLYTVITAVGLFVFTRILAPIFDRNGTQRMKHHHESAKDSASTEPAQLEITTQNHTSNAPVPRVKVEQVESAGRMHTQTELGASI